MSPHPLPSAPQRCHWYVNEVGAFAHVPLWAVSVFPCRAVPVIVGGEVLLGVAAVLAMAEVAKSAAASTAMPIIVLIFIRNTCPDERA